MVGYAKKVGRGVRIMGIDIEMLKKYKTNIFVETGSYIGDGINTAIEMKFKKIFSIEVSRKFFNYCRERFYNIINVKLLYGDSGKILYDIIKNIKEPITFWLDAHYSGGKMQKRKSPILNELKQIAKHRIKTHTIMVDDISCYKTKRKFKILQADILKEIKKINKDYIVEFTENDILLVEV